MFVKHMPFNNMHEDINWIIVYNYTMRYKFPKNYIYQIRCMYFKYM